MSSSYLLKILKQKQHTLDKRTWKETLLTHRHQRHTSHNIVDMLLQHDKRQRDPGSSQHISSSPSKLYEDWSNEKPHKFSYYIINLFVKKNLNMYNEAESKTWNMSNSLTLQGSRRSCSVTSGQVGLTFQEFPNSSGVDSTMPCIVVKSFSASPSKFPHRPSTLPRKWGASRT